MKSERWDCESDDANYSIIYFGKYYGYYGLYVWSDVYGMEKMGFLNYNGDIVCGSAKASAVGLPKEAQFKSVDECKEIVSEIYEEVAEKSVIWRYSNE